MNWFECGRNYRVLKKYAIVDNLWLETTAQLPLLDALEPGERSRCRVLATLFIHDKAFSGAQGLKVTESMKVVIAAQACVPILKLGLDAYDGWHEIIVYPDAFQVERQYTDESGLVIHEKNVLTGEAWQQGPVILSWTDIARDSFRLHPGQHVVIHEFAHKLDMLNGRANGMPPLHPEMPIEQWTASLSQAYDHLIKNLQLYNTSINSYAATNPAEFFSVVCEYFFTAPEILYHNFPDVYQQLKRYFRQDPLSRRL